MKYQMLVKKQQRILDDRGIVRVGAEVMPGDILSWKSNS